MRVKCISEPTINKENLTMFKRYEVVDELVNQYRIIDNSGKFNLYSKELFEVEEEFNKK